MKKEKEMDSPPWQTWAVFGLSVAGVVIVVLGTGWGWVQNHGSSVGWEFLLAFGVLAGECLWSFIRSENLRQQNKELEKKLREAQFTLAEEGRE